MKEFSNNQNFAIYSLPDSKELYYIEGELADFDGQKGFIVQPFTGTKKIIIGEDTLISDFNFKVSDVLENNVQSQADYLKMVNTAKTSLNDEFKKIVLSRIIERATDYDVTTLFKQLVNQYPKTFVSLINTTEHGTWIGASPEHLLAYDNKSGVSMALAGTQKKNETGKYVWSTKETNEQEYVAQFVEDHLKKLSIAYDKTNSDKETGNVAHICSVYNFDYSVNVELLPDILHPTPAVCGTPTAIAKAEILNLEPHARNLYTGYIGPRTEKATQLFVNLRCMHVGGNKTHVYVGGGITKDSDPEKEWEETQLKSQTLLSVIENL